MGVQFTSASPEAVSILEQALDRLAREAEENSAPESIVRRTTLLSADSATALLAEASRHLADEGVLTLREFATLLRSRDKG